MNNWYEKYSWDVGGTSLHRSIESLESQGCLRANLTHRLADFLELDLLRDRPNDLRWSVHLSAQVLKQQSVSSFLEKISLLPNPVEILVVSGNPKPKRDSLILANELSYQSNSIALAISPFDLSERVQAKCKARHLTSLYFQVCTDTKQLSKQVALVRSFNPHVRLSACWLVPTRANWQAMHLFPWSGAHFTEAWLSSYDTALEVAQQQLRWMISENMEPLIEPRRLTATTFLTAGLFENTF